MPAGDEGHWSRSCCLCRRMELAQSRLCVGVREVPCNDAKGTSDGHSPPVCSQDKSKPCVSFEHSKSLQRQRATHTSSFMNERSVACGDLYLRLLLALGLRLCTPPSRDQSRRYRLVWW